MVIKIIRENGSGNCIVNGTTFSYSIVNMILGVKLDYGQEIEIEIRKVAPKVKRYYSSDAVGYRIRTLRFVGFINESLRVYVYRSGKGHTQRAIYSKIRNKGNRK